MNRRRWFIILVILIPIVVFFFFAMSPRVYQREVIIPYSLLKVREQLTVPANIAKWYYPFSSSGVTGAGYEESHLQRLISGEYSLQLNETKQVGAYYTAGRSNRVKNFLFTITTDSIGAESKVILTYKSSPLSKWLGKNDLEVHAEKSLQQLKERMEDSKAMYGFEIQNEPVVDTAFLFKTKTVKLSERSQGMKQLFDELLKYAQDRKIDHNGVKIFYSQRRGVDELELYAGIGVNQYVITEATDPVQFKRMPAGKNLLSAFYQGPYGKVHEAYEALNEFKTDHRLISMAIPFEKFLGSDYSFTDSQTVQLKVYYPIF